MDMSEGKHLSNMNEEHNFETLGGSKSLPIIMRIGMKTSGVRSSEEVAFTDRKFYRVCGRGN